MLDKCILAVTAAEAKEACGTEQLCSVLKAWIERGSMWCGSCGSSMPRRRNWVSSLLMRAMCSMRRISQPCYGWFATSGPVVHSLHSTANATGPHW